MVMAVWLASVSRSGWQEVNVLGQAMLRVRRERHDIAAVEPGQAVRGGQPFVSGAILFQGENVGIGQTLLRTESFELRPVDPIEPIFGGRPEVTRAIGQQVAEGLVPDGRRVDRSEVDEFAAIEAGQANPRGKPKVALAIPCHGVDVVLRQPMRAVPNLDAVFVGQILFDRGRPDLRLDRSRDQEKRFVSETRSANEQGQYMDGERLPLCLRRYGPCRHQSLPAG